MSLTKPADHGPKNPAQMFIEWKGARVQGFFQHYDKTIEDKAKRNVKVELKDFVILDDDLFSVAGYDEGTKTSYQSNEVRRIDDQLIIRSYKDGKSKIVLQGTYEDLKPRLKEMEIGYQKRIYAFLDGQIVQIKLHGSSFAQWLKDVKPNAKHTSSLISHVKTVEAQKGTLEYKYPVFEVGGPIPADVLAAASTADGEILQPYLEAYLNKKSKPAPAEDQAQEQNKDLTLWREIASLNGGNLGSLSLVDLEELQENLAANDPNCDLIDYVGQALYDIQGFKSSFSSKKDDNGRFLKDYSLDEVTAILSKMPPNHKARQLLLVAQEHLTPVASLEDEDDIPF